MFWGSGELTVEAKFPPCTGGIFAMWTFRSDVCPAENGQGMYSLKNTAGEGEGELIQILLCLINYHHHQMTY